MKNFFFVVLIATLLSACVLPIVEDKEDLPTDIEIYQTTKTPLSPSEEELIELQNDSIILSDRHIDECLAMGEKCQYQLGCCIWNWDNDPPTYSCGCVLYKK